MKMEMAIPLSHSVFLRTCQVDLLTTRGKHTDSGIIEYIENARRHSLTSPANQSDYAGGILPRSTLTFSQGDF